MRDQNPTQIDEQAYQSAYERVREEIRSLRDWAADQDLEALFGLEGELEGNSDGPTEAAK